MAVRVVKKPHPAQPGLLTIIREDRRLMMPVVAAWLASAAFTIGATAVTWGTVVSIAFTIASYAYNAYSAAQARAAAKANFNASLKDRLVMTATTDAPRSRCYGRVRNVDGVLFKNTHGALHEFYTFVIALAGHEIDAVEQVWFGDVPLVLDGSGYVQTQPYAITSAVSASVTGTTSGGAGSVTLPGILVAGSVHVVQTDNNHGDWPLAFTLVGNVVSYSGGDPLNDPYGATVSYQNSSIKSNARVTAYLGAPGQDLSGALIALGCPDATVNHKFQGIACLLVTLTYNTDSFPQGVPNMNAVLRGAKILDPRTGLTAWSRNPALIARDWALYSNGGGAMPADYDDVIGNASANACDLVQTFTSDVTGPVSLPTYLCDIVAPTQTDPTPTLNEIVNAMAGKYAWCGGILRVKAGYHGGAVIDIDESFLSGMTSIDVTSGVPRVDLVNSYRPSISDASKGYVTSPTAAVRATAYITADGVELPRDITLAAVTDAIHAQHVCGVMLRDSRQHLTIKLPCNLKAYPIEVFDVVTVTLPHFGWAAKEFEVLTWDFSPTGGVELTMKETVASIYTPSSVFTAGDDAPNTSLPLPWSVPAPTNLVVSSGATLNNDGSVVVRVLATWDATTIESVRQSGTFELQYWPASSPMPAGDWISAPPIGGSATRTVFIGPSANAAYLFRLRQINSIGVRSPWGVQVMHLVDKVASIVPDWTAIIGRPILFRAYTVGRLVAGSGGLFNGETGVAYVVATPRSYLMARIRRSDGVVVFSQVYDVWGAGGLTSGRDAAALAADLNATTSDYIVAVISVNEPQGLRMTGGLPAAMYRCGASPSVFGSPLFQFGSAYVLVGIGGCGTGNGYEAYSGAIADDPAAFVDVAFELKGGNMIVTGAGGGPRTLGDYGYTGALDATSDISLIARGQCVLAGNYASKLGGVAAWDSDVYSRDSATFAAIASAQVVDITNNVMFGLNSDPLTDQNYTSLDYAWYVATGTLAIFENGAAQITGLAGANGDVLTVLYDGSNVRYLQNGVVRRTVAAAPGLTLFWDSSFYSPGAALKHVRFGALSANDWASIGNVNVQTGQIGTGAVTQSFVSAPGTMAIGSSSGTPSGYTAGHWQLLATVSFTPTVASRALLACSAGVSWVGNTSTFANKIYCVVNSHIDLANTGVYDVANDFGSVAFSEPWDNTSTIQVQDKIGFSRLLNVIAGTSYTFNWYVNKFEHITTTAINPELRVDLLKR